MSEVPETSSSPITASPARVAPSPPSPPPSTGLMGGTTAGIRRALNLTKLDPQDDWLPITESRNGNAYYAAFHTLCSGIGAQALLLPVALFMMGWVGGIISLILTFIWQLYTLWLLIHLHESTETGMRYNRYLQLCCATFGNKLGKWLALFPIMYLSGGTCIALIVIGGSTLSLFFKIACDDRCMSLTTVEWYLVFACAAVVLSQLPNLNSIAGVSLIGAVTGVGYCISLWVISLAKGRIEEVDHESPNPLLGAIPALGLIAFAFRGHNLILEIQATMPSSEKYPSHVPMWKGVKFAYLIIAICIFPLAIGGYWAYGSSVGEDLLSQLSYEGGMLKAVYQSHSRQVPRSVLGFISLLIIVNALSSFQIYAMPMFDQIESQYTRRFHKPCAWWLRAMFRCIFTYFCFFVAVAIPFYGSLAVAIGGVSMPVTLAYPCFMWLKIKKPKVYSGMWWLNWGLGILGMAFSVLLVGAGIFFLIAADIRFSFFNPQNRDDLITTYY